MTDTQPRPKVGQRIRHTQTHIDGTLEIIEGVVGSVFRCFVIIGGKERTFGVPTVSWEVLAEPQPPLRLGMVANIRRRDSKRTWLAVLRRTPLLNWDWFPLDTSMEHPLVAGCAVVVGKPEFDGIGDPL